MMLEEAVSSFENVGWELTSRDSQLLRGFSKLYMGLDWALCCLLGNIDTSFQSGLDVDASALDQKFAQQYLELKSATLEGTYENIRTPILPSTLWGGYKHRAPAGVMILMEDNDLMIRTGKVTYRKVDIVTFAKKALEFVKSAPFEKSRNTA